MSAALSLLEEEAELLRVLEERTAARNSFAAFCTYILSANPRIKLPLSRFQYKLCELLEKLYYREIPRCMINLPYGHSKSTLANKLFPAWCLGQDPNLRIMTVSHNLQQATEFSRDTREIIKDPRYKLIFPDTQVAKDADGQGLWRISRHSGSYGAAGITSGIQGRRADIVIADDLLGNQEDVNSEIERNRRWSNFADDLLSRLDAGGRALMIASRQHVDDPCGRIEKMIKENNWDWSVFKFPAIAEQDDLLGRKPGEALWPEYIPIKSLEEIRTSGRYSEGRFSAVYQQRPMPEGGSIIKREHWRIWGGVDANGVPIITIPDLDHVVMSVDTAFKAKQTSDYSAVSLWGIFRPPMNEISWEEKVSIIRESDNSAQDLGVEFGVPPSYVTRIRDGEDIDEPTFDTFDLMARRRSRLQTRPYHMILIDCWHARLPFPDLRRKIIAYHEEWQPNVVIVEDKASGQSLLQELAEVGIAAQGWNPGREDKVFRANMIAGVFEQGLVYAVGKALKYSQDRRVVERSDEVFAPAAELMISECETFPTGAHDDLVDSAVQAVHYLRRMHAFKLDDDVPDEDDDLGEQGVTRVKIELGEDW